MNLRMKTFKRRNATHFVTYLRQTLLGQKVLTSSRQLFTLATVIVPSKVRDCPVPPELLRSEISFSRTCNISNPAQESIKCYTSQKKFGIMLPIISLRLPGTRDIRYFRTKLCFTSRRPLFNHFRNKIVSAQRNIHIIQILCPVPPNRGFYRDILFVCKKRHPRVRSVFSSYQVMVLGGSSHIRFRCSCLAKQVLHLKSHWNVKAVRCPKFVTHQVNMGGIVPQFSIYRLSGPFL